jgi:hypothetical protein
MPGRSLGSQGSGWHWKPDPGSHWQIAPGPRPVTVTVAAPGADPRAGATAIARLRAAMIPARRRAWARSHIPKSPLRGRRDGLSRSRPSQLGPVIMIMMLVKIATCAPVNLKLPEFPDGGAIVTRGISMLTVSPHPGKRSAGMHRGGEHSIRRPVPLAVAERLGACPWKLRKWFMLVSSP